MRRTRSRLRLLVVGALLGAVLPAAPAAAQSATYQSRPDLRPPAITTTSSGAGPAPGYNFVDVRADTDDARFGALIYDAQGEPLWFRPGFTRNFHPDTWFGSDVLVWFESSSDSWVVADASYREMFRFGAGDGYVADFHDVELTPWGTALVMIYDNVTYDLSPYGGAPNAIVTEGVIQELDPATGEVLWQWSSLDEGGIPITDTYRDLADDVVDYLHINSVTVDRDGGILVSARHTSSVFKIDRETGDVAWRLGGRRSSFTFADGEGGPSWPHDARRRRDGSISIFDNGVDRDPRYSRGVAYDLDLDAGTATVAGEWVPSPALYTAIIGSNREQPDGSMLASFGTTGVAKEWRAGELVWESSFDSRPQSTYRTVRASWDGYPDQPPAVAVTTNGSSASAWATWNGRTGVARWQLLAGTDARSLRVVGSAARDGFETRIDAAVAPTDDTFSVRALSSTGVGLGRAIPVSVPDAGADAAIATRGGAGEVVVRTLDEGLWSSPRRRGGRIVGSPDATVLLDGARLLAVQGDPNGLYTKRVAPDGSESPWAAQGGAMIAPPSVTTRRDGSALVALCGTNGRVYLTTVTAGNRALGFRSIGGDCSGGGPAVVEAADGTIIVSSVGSDRSVRAYVGPPGAALNGRWRGIGGLAHSDVGATLTASQDAVIIAVRGRDGAVWRHDLRRTAGWSGGAWTSLGGYSPSDAAPDLVRDRSDGSLRVVVEGRDGWLWQRVGSLSGVNGWQRV